MEFDSDQEEQDLSVVGGGKVLQYGALPSEDCDREHQRRDQSIQDDVAPLP